MMKWKTKKGAINVGSIAEHRTFNQDYLEICIDICDMSDDLKLEVNKAVELEKAKYSEEWNEILENTDTTKRYSTKWSNKPVVIDFTCLWITLDASKPITYVISTGFHDAENERLAPVAEIEVDLSEYTNELKAAVIHVLIDKFFVKANQM